MEEKSGSETSCTELDCNECNAKESDWLTMGSTVTQESYTSLSSDDSLGLLSESQIESAWHSDTESEDLFPNFQKFDVVVKQFSQNISWANSNRDEDPEISPICAQEKSSTIDLSTLESTPRIKQSLQEIGQKFSTSYHEDILNRTVNLSSVCGDGQNETFTAVESDEESNLECKILNITHPIERGDKESETSLNRTFGTLNILNKTLPSVISTMESPSYVQNKTFTDNPKYINETKSYACDPKKHELPVKVKHSQKILSSTVTKIKNKTNKSTENSPSSSSSNILDSTISLHPKGFVNETDFSQTGTKKKIFKADRGKSKLRTNSSSKTDSTSSIKNKPRKILSSSNRDLKVLESSSAFDKHISMSSGHTIDPEIPLQNITIPRGNFTRQSILQKKAPINLSFKKVSKDPLSQKQVEKLYKEEIILKNEDYFRQRYKESSRLSGFGDYKLSLYGSIKEIEKARNRREFLDIPTIRLVEEPHTEQRIFSRSTRTVSRPQYHTSDVTAVPHTLSAIAKPQSRLQGRRPVLPLPGRELVHPPHQRMPGDYQRRSYGRGGSRIPTLRQRAFGPGAVFATVDPFDPPVQGRMSTVPKKSHGSNGPPSQN